MRNIKELFKLLISMPKSIVVNCMSLPINQAVKLPVLVSYDTKILSLRGKVILKDPSFGMIRIGFGGAGSASTIRSILDNNGTLEFKRPLSMGGGSRLCTITDNSSIVFGKNTYFMGDTLITAASKITFGSNCLISWGTQFIDTDFHKIFMKDGEKQVNPDATISIGENVWIASNVNILKGVIIPSGVVVASGSTVSKPIEYGNCIVAGMPIKILKEDVYWEP